MTLSKEQRQEVAAMVARAIAATGGGVDVQAVETAAQEPGSKFMFGVQAIHIITAPKGVDGVAQPDAGIGLVALIRGTVNGQSHTITFAFPPNDQAYLSELKRVQSYPHLFQKVLLYFREHAVGGASIPILTHLEVHYDATQ